MIAALAFYAFAAILIASAVMVVTSRNPVHSVLFLILAFFNAAALFLIAGAEFLAMILVIVYVGAVAVLFLFVVMMLDIDFSRLREGFQRYAPVGALVGGILFLELVLRARRLELRRRGRGAAAGARRPADGVSNAEALGRILYTDYVYLFQAAGLILLVAMIGAIVLTLRERPGTRRQDIGAQINRAGSVSLRPVPSGRRAGAARHRAAAGAGGAERARPSRMSGHGHGGGTTEMAIGLAHYLTVGAILLVLGILGIFLNRKNVIVILMSVELILLSVNLNFVAFSACARRPGGPGLRHVRAHRRGGGGGDRPRHRGDLLPQHAAPSRSRTSRP